MIRYPDLLAVATLALLVLAGCSREPAFPPLGTGAVVLAFGDSVTHGTGAGSAPNYPQLLAETTGWRVINGGVPGDTARGARERLPSLLERHDPRLVIVELGGNDFLRKHPDEQVKENLRSILRAARDAGAIPVLLAVPHLSLLRATTGTLSDASLYGDLAEEENVLLIEDVFSSVLSDANLRADPIHPNGRGYRVLTEGIVSGLRSAGLLP